MKLTHSRIEKTEGIVPASKQSKFIRGVKVIGREFSKFAGAMVLAGGLSVFLLFPSCGSSPTGTTPKIEDVSQPDRSQPSDTSSYFTFCPDKNKVVYGGGPDPITTLQIGDKINLDENHYLEFAGVNSEGKAVFNIKSKSTDDLIGLVILGQGEQKTITSADGKTTLTLEVCTIGIDGVTIGANTKLDSYSPPIQDISPDEEVITEVQAEYTDAQNDYSYDIEVEAEAHYDASDAFLDYNYEVSYEDEVSQEADLQSACDPILVTEWCDGVTALLNKGETLQLPDCYRVTFDDVDTTIPGSPAALFTLSSSSGGYITKFKVPANAFGSKKVENPDNDAIAYNIMLNDLSAGYTFLATWVNFSVAPSTESCKKCTFNWSPFGGIYNKGEAVTLFGCLHITVGEVENLDMPGENIVYLYPSIGTEALDPFNLWEYSHADLALMLPSDSPFGGTFEASFRIDAIELAPGYPMPWAQLVFSTNSDSEICTDSPEGLLAENTSLGVSPSLGASQTLTVGWDKLKIKNYPPDNKDMVEFNWMQYPFTLGDSIMVSGTNTYYQVAVCSYNEALKTYHVQVFALK